MRVPVERNRTGWTRYGQRGAGANLTRAAGVLEAAAPDHSIFVPSAKAWIAVNTSSLPVGGLTPRRPNSVNSSGGRLPIQRTPVRLPAPSRNASACQPGFCSTAVTRRPAGKRNSTVIVADLRSLGTRNSYFSRAPGALCCGDTVTLAAALVASAAAARAIVRRIVYPFAAASAARPGSCVRADTALGRPRSVRNCRQWSESSTPPGLPPAQAARLAAAG